MRRTQRLIAACVLIAFSGALGGCSSGGFDPTDLLDFLDTKKKLPGERKPVFPEGVPGLEQGVPKDLYKGAQQRDPNAQAAVAAAPPPQEPPSKQAGKSKKGKPSASVAAAPAAAAPDAEAAPEEDTTPAAPPAPKPKKIARKRTTAPPADGSDAQAGQSAQQGAPFPAPVPSGTFTR
jgi:hypothetical protein